MTDAYRDQGARCPACQLMMEPKILEGCTVDVCSRCRGLWVDWFDGELFQVTREVGALSQREPVALPPDAPCPRCHRKLEWGKPHTLLRCGECGGTFVPRPAFDEILALAMEASAGDEGRPVHPFVRLLRALFGGPSEPPVGD